MATIPSPAIPPANDYPDSDGKPMAESDVHRDLMCELIDTLKDFFASRRRIYVSGNLMLFYELGNRRRYVAPDVFVVKGVAKHNRRNYLMWEEGKGPDVVIEVTSFSTRRKDLHRKLLLYRDTLHVKEYFLFDPFEEYLRPSMRGYRLRKGVYWPIAMVNGRLPSQVLRLHLERDGTDLRLYDPGAGRWHPTIRDQIAQAEAQRQKIEAETERFRQEAEMLRRQTEVLQQKTRALRRAIEYSHRTRQPP